MLIYKVALAKLSSANMDAWEEILQFTCLWLAMKQNVRMQFHNIKNVK